MPRATLVGCSSGSALAIDFAIRQPEKVEQLVLIGAVVHGMPSSDHFDERGRNNSAPLDRGDVKAAALNWSQDPYEIAGANPAARRTLYAALAGNPQNLRYKGDLEIRFLRPAVARLSEIHVPTLILVGEHDIPDVHAQSGAIQAGIWGAQRKVVKGAGHLVPLEKPAELAAEITSFVDNHRLASIPPQTLETYAGKYRLFGGTGEFVVEDGRLVLRLPAEKDLPVYPLSATKFFMIIWGEMQFEFVKDASGKVTGVDLVHNGEVQHCARV